MFKELIINSPSTSTNIYLWLASGLNTLKAVRVASNWREITQYLVKSCFWVMEVSTIFFVGKILFHYTYAKMIPRGLFILLVAVRVLQSLIRACRFFIHLRFIDEIFSHFISFNIITRNVAK